MQHNGATYRHCVIFDRKSVYTHEQHRGATFSPYYVLGCATQSFYTRKFASKHQGSMRTRPTALDKLMMEKVTKVAVGILRTTTGSKGTHGKIGVEQQKRIKVVRSMIGLVTNISLFYSIDCYSSC